MKTIEKGGHLICYDEYILEENSDLKKFLSGDNLNTLLENFKEKVIVVLGGDGTILRAIRENYNKNMPFLGINFGTKGFLLNDKSAIFTGMEYEKRSYPLLGLKTKTESKNLSDIAINEIDIRSNSGRVIDLDINLSNKGKLNILGDGIIISTPAGSTGYNSSLGGPILPHTLDLLVLTSKAPLKPKGQAPIIIDSGEKIIIKNNGRKNETVIYTDGISLFNTLAGENFTIEITKSEYKVDLIIAKNYLKTWDNKVLSEQGFNV